MAQVSVRVHINYKDKKAIPSTYNVEWNSSKRDFEGFMLDLMNTLVTLETDSTFDKIDIMGIDVIRANEDERKEITQFKKDNDING